MKQRKQQKQQKTWSLKVGGENKTRLIRKQEVKYLMSIVFNIRMKISELLNMVAFSSIYSLILI